MGSGDIFFDTLGIAGFIDKENVALIAPSLGNGYYVNSIFERQADFLNDELWPAIIDNLPISPDPAENFIMGVSMGAFGALRWALANKCFAAAASISGVFDTRITPDERIKKSRKLRPLHKLFGERLMPKLLLDDSGDVRPDADLDALLATSHGQGPRLAFYCGEADYLSLNQTHVLAEKARGHGLKTEIYLNAGSHTTQYWAETAPKAMNWLLAKPTNNREGD
jgi:S-formylglutathione hydrolase FrmB